MKNFRIPKLCLTALVAIYFWDIVFHPTVWHFIDNVDLIFHEAGHPLMLFFGTFLHIAGGTIFQLGIPALIALYFYKRDEFFSASLILFWLGQSFINVSIYAGDAIVQNLDLLGGDSAGHDWTNMLSILGILKYTPVVAGILFYVGLIIIICATCFSFIHSKKNEEI